MNLSQSQTANDVCSCRACNMEQPVTIIPDLPVNKWKCRNCNLIQVWQPSSSFNQVHEVVSKTRALTQGTLFNNGPLVGIGADGCLSGVYANPEHLTNIIISGIGIAILAVIIEYYRVKYPVVVAKGNRRDALYASPPRQKASNKVSGVDNWNRQPPILRVSVMSKAQSIAKDKKRGRLLISSLFQSFQSIPKTSKLSQS